jgi:predicted Zn-dependent peptidase
LESVPDELGGLAHLTAESLRRGTRHRTAEQFATELDSLGAAFGTEVTEQATHIETEFLAKDFHKGLELFVDALTAPAFPEPELKKLVAQRIDQARALKDRPEAAANDYYRNFFFGSHHPYGAPVDEVTLAAITRDQIAAYHKRVYTGRNMIFTIVGDIDPEAAGRAVSKALGEVAAGQPYAWKAAPIPKRPSTAVALVDRPGATQTQILIGLPGIERRHPDRIALWLVNTLFGGRFTSILNDELRVNSGLTYGARSQFDRALLPGRITISTFTATENTGRALDMAVSLLKKLAQTGLTAEQLSSTKAYIKGTYPLHSLETADQLAGIVTDLELFDLNRGEVDDMFARIDAVTLEQANAIARRYFRADGLTILLLGSASLIAPQVTKYDAEPVRISVTTPGLRVPQSPRVLRK